MKKTFRYIACTFFVLFLILLAPFLFSPLVNNYRLALFADQFNTLILPHSTVEIERQRLCGKLNGNGNSMDYVVCSLIQSDLSRNELYSFYSTIQFNAVEQRSDHKPTLEVIPLTTANVPSLYLIHHTLSFRSLQNTSDFSGFYAVLLYDGSYNADFDWRGH